MEGWCQDISGFLCLLGKADGTGAWLPERASRGGNDLEGQGRQCGGRKGAWGGHTWCWGRGPGAGLLGVRFEPLLAFEGFEGPFKPAASGAPTAVHAPARPFPSQPFYFSEPPSGRDSEPSYRHSADKERSRSQDIKMYLESPKRFQELLYPSGKCRMPPHMSENKKMPEDAQTRVTNNMS